MTREQVQKSAVKSIKNSKYSGILDISPRVGKSKILLDSLKGSKKKIAIIAPYQSIVDSWGEEITKWSTGLDITLHCSKSVNKVKNADILVVDEIQTLSDRQINTIKKLNIANIIGLTGTLSVDTENKLGNELGLDVIYTYSIDQAIKDGIIANFDVVIVKCNLNSTRVNVPSGSKKKPIMRSEKSHYDFLTTNYEKFKKLSWTDRSFEFLKDYYMSKRRDFIYTAQSKIDVAKRIVSKGNRALVFTGRIPQAEYFTQFCHHSKNRKEDNLTKFINGDIDQLSVINMVNMGITIPELKTAVVHQLQSNSEMSLQKILRMCNLEGDKVAKIYITCYKDTVDEKWVNSALEYVDSSRIRIIDESMV